ncbi:hypothetical protein Golax_019957, partial [Gossypium laxum]|nr:hypothetical protein [Gossypium laxum]
HCNFPYYDQLTSIYAKDQAFRKDAQTTANIVEEIDVEDVAIVNNLEEGYNYHGCEDDVFLDEMDVSTIQSQRENIRTVDLELSRSIAFEKVIQESAKKLYPALCEIEGLTEDER